MRRNQKAKDRLEKKSTEEQLSFFEKIRTDKKYSAKVQLIGYGVLIGFLVISLNIANMGKHVTNSSIVPNNANNDNVSVDSTDTGNLLKKINTNYQYDQHLTLKKKDVDQEYSVHYYGKSYDKQLEINKEDAVGTATYYKIEDRYYVKEDTGVVFMDEDKIYNLVDGEYLELYDIKKLMDKASLDHVTDYSSGKKEYVYHLKVKDVILSYQKEDVVEIGAIIENDVLTVQVDYSNLFKVIDESIETCKMKITYTEIGKVEKFQILGEENTSVE